MSEEPGQDSQAPVPPRFNREEGQRLLVSLDRKQHAMVSEHLYSTHLLRQRLHRPAPSWIVWPNPTTAMPYDIDETEENDEPGDAVSEEELSRRKHDAELGHPSRFVPPPPTRHIDDERERESKAAKILFQACTGYLQKVVDDRIRADGLQPVLDRKPQLGPLEPVLLDTLDRFFKPIRHEPLASLPLDWSKLAITGPAIERLERLFGPIDTFQPSKRLQNPKAKKSKAKKMKGEAENMVNAASHTTSVTSSVNGSEMNTDTTTTTSRANSEPPSKLAQEPPQTLRSVDSAFQTTEQSTNHLPNAPWGDSGSELNPASEPYMSSDRYATGDSNSSSGTETGLDTDEEYEH